MSAPAVERALRADAQRNLESILEAAAAAFAENGLEACVADIARRAGVGQATIFRRFETKEDLIEAVVARKMVVLLEHAEQAAGRKRAWDGLREFMTFGVEVQMTDRGLFEVVADRLVRDERLLALHEQIFEVVGGLVERAKAEGDLRRDIQPQDFPVLVCATAQAGLTVRSADPELWRRYLQILLDGLRADGCRGRLRPSPPPMGALRRSMTKRP
jgi:AcrR family transcriptional regulator